VVIAKMERSASLLKGEKRAGEKEITWARKKKDYASLSNNPKKKREKKRCSQEKMRASSKMKEEASHLTPSEGVGRPRKPARPPRRGAG